ncbi:MULTISPECIES: hypothetical protein [unclassified Rhodococcus (in: high G+C Gram-positive bacteria)]|uniref:hypothetical protein n=1 Tax=unclassified Rhodococcus (in: high G+C Gram-positive bacteria) TaxID=192944 RepID=UPI001ED955D9|nr:hypothetical protein [Rhodococcus sp. DK17]
MRTPLQGAFDDDVLASLQAHLADVVDDFGGFGVDQGREFPGGAIGCASASVVDSRSA